MTNSDNTSQIRTLNHDEWSQLILSAYISGVTSGVMSLSLQPGAVDFVQHIAECTREQAMWDARHLVDSMLADPNSLAAIVSAVTAMHDEGYDCTPYAAGPMCVYESPR